MVVRHQDAETATSWSIGSADNDRGGSRAGLLSEGAQLIGLEKVVLSTAALAA
jgi:hypothetical protein